MSVFKSILKLLLLSLVCATTSWQLNASEIIRKTFMPTEIVIVTDEWMPYTGAEAGIEKGQAGYLIDMAKAIYEPLGIKVIYQVQPWEKALHAVRSKTADCIAGTYRSDAPDFLFPKMEQGHSYDRFYALSHANWNYDNVSSLQHIRLAIIGGYSYDDGGPIDDYIGSSLNSTLLQIVNGNGALGQNIQKILTGRADATIENELVFNLKIKELGLTEKFKSVGQIEKQKKVYIACGPAKPTSIEFIRLLEEGMERIRGNGELAKILEKYQLKDWINTP